MSDQWSAATWGSSKATNRSISPRSHWGREAIPAAVAHPSRSGATHSLAGPPQGTKRSHEYVHRFAGLTVGLASVLSEHVLSHPCIVLRRQCQSVTTLWKGIGSSLMVKGLAVATETTIHEFTPFPREVNRHSSLKKFVEHLLLKGITLIIVTPFLATSLVETVQSEIACERPGVFDCIVEGVGRLMSFTSTQPTRLLPIWKLILPTIVYGLSHYIIASLAKYRVTVKMKTDLRLVKGGSRDGDVVEGTEQSIYETYYPELVATFTGNLLADTLLYPLETILYRLYLQGTRTIIDNTDTGLEVVPIITRYDGAFDCYSGIVAEEGFAGLYKGFGGLVLQYGLHVAVLKLTRLGFDLMSSNEIKTDFAPVSNNSLRVSTETQRPVTSYLSPCDSDYTN